MASKHPFSDVANSNTLAAIVHEKMTADTRYGSFTSTHEGYGVLAEEVAELLDAIRSNDADAIRSEACQVAAVSWRLAESLHSVAVQNRSGLSGKP